VAEVVMSVEECDMETGIEEAGGKVRWNMQLMWPWSGHGNGRCAAVPVFPGSSSIVYKVLSSLLFETQRL
jgi:hypothetical protein